METRLPNRIQGEVVALATADCELPVERVSAMTDGFFVQAWTVPLMLSCELMLGQHVLATPLLGGSDIKWHVHLTTLGIRAPHARQISTTSPS